MICSRKIYKGEDAEVSIPFLVSGWTSLYVEYFTDGDTKVVRQEDELEIDEYTITAQFEGDDLGLLDDGVIYYTIHYVYDDENYIKSTNTPYVLCTPAGYSGKTEEDIYQSGWTGGYGQGYERGYEQGYQEGIQAGIWDKMVQIGYGEIGINDPLAAIFLDQTPVRETGYFEVQSNTYYSGGTGYTYDFAVGIKPTHYTSLVLKPSIIPPKNITIYGNNRDSWNITCNNFVAADDVSVDDLFQYITPDYREFPFGLSYLKPTDIDPAYRKFSLDGVYDTYDTIPAGTHSIGLLVDTNKYGMIINLENFNGDITMQ